MNQLKVDWLPIEQACAAGLNFAEAEKKFGVLSGTIRRRAARHKWILPKHVAIAVRAKNEIAVQKAAENWLEKGENHRETAFKIASESVKKFRPKAPKNFRELEAADKIARRAAGLDTGEGLTVQTLINLNERMNNHEDETVIEASSVEVEAVVAPPSPSTPSTSPDTSHNKYESGDSSRSTAPDNSTSSEAVASEAATDAQSSAA